MQGQILSNGMVHSNNFPPHVVKQLVQAQSTTEGFYILQAHMLSKHQMDQHMNLDNPIVHLCINGVMDRLKEKQMWADEISKKMRKLQRLQEEWEVASRDEKNWIDIEEKEERPFILEGRRISKNDLQVLLEIAVKMNMLADDMVIGAWLTSHLQIKNGKNKVPMGKSFGRVMRSD